MWRNSNHPNDPVHLLLKPIIISLIDLHLNFTPMLSCKYDSFLNLNKLTVKHRQLSASEHVPPKDFVPKPILISFISVNSDTVSFTDSLVIMSPPIGPASDVLLTIRS